MSLEQIVVFMVGPLIGYLLGSVPFSFLIGISHGVDIRKIGSGNVGATNLARALGDKKYFFQAFLLDAGKGFLPTLVMALLVRRWNDAGVPAWAPLFTSAAAFFGHLFPIYLKFRGGKGVATAFGVVLGFWPLFTLAGLGAGFIFLVVFFGWRYISLASIIACISFAFLVLAVGRSQNPWLDTPMPWHDLTPLVAAAGLLALVIVYRHRANIVRLLQGTEPKAGQKA